MKSIIELKLELKDRKLELKDRQQNTMEQSSKEN